MEAWIHRIPSPLGDLYAVRAEGAIVGLSFDPEAAEHRWAAGPGAATIDSRALLPLQRQLGDYFEGRRRCFDLPLDLRGTPFQRRVWEEVGRIPWGHTATYGDLARRLGAPGSARAIGAAVGANPVLLLVPCHRVLGASGRLTGYAGGLDRKARLLRLEGGEPAVRSR